MTLSFLPELNPFFCILALASHRDGEVKRKENHLDVKKEVPSIQIVRLEFPILIFVFLHVAFSGTSLIFGYSFK